MTDTPHIPGAEIADELREHMKLKYIGNCKCGQCQLVPLDLIARAADALAVEKVFQSSPQGETAGLTSPSLIAHREQLTESGVASAAPLDPATVKALATELLAAREALAARIVPEGWKAMPVETIKPLEWEEVAATDHVARSIIGEYSIVGTGNSWSLHMPWRPDRDYFGTLREAKSAAQADYEQRIRSTLASPSPGTATAGAAAVEDLNRWYIRRREEDIDASKALLAKLRVQDHPAHCRSWANEACSCGISDRIDEIERHLNGMLGNEPFYTTPEHGWTCFHCGETFTTAEGAIRHFGQPENIRPACFALAPSAAGRVERLETALKPFAKLAEDLAAGNPGWYHDQFEVLVIGEFMMTLEPFIAARQALEDRS